jgi:hypothetical protein
MTDSTIFSSTYPTQGQDGFATTLNDFLREHDRLVMLTVENRTQTGAPAGVEGNAYIAASGVSGWTGTKDGVADQTYAANDVIAYLGGGWVGWAPQEGWSAYDKFTELRVTYDGAATAWQVDQGGTAQVTTGISAAGTTEGAATQLNVGISQVTTITAASAEAVKLPAAEAGLVCYVGNDDATDTLKVFPKSGDNLNGGTGSVDVAALKGAMFFAVDGTDWYGVVSS